MTMQACPIRECPTQLQAGFAAGRATTLRDGVLAHLQVVHYPSLTKERLAELFSRYLPAERAS